MTGFGCARTARWAATMPAVVDQVPRSVIYQGRLRLWAVVALVLGLLIAPSWAATDVWQGLGSTGADTGHDMNKTASWSLGAIPTSTSDALLNFDSASEASASAGNAVVDGSAFNAQNLTISNSTTRISTATKTDVVSFNQTVTLSSNFVFSVTGGASAYSLSVTFGANTTIGANATFNGASITPGQTASAFLNLGNASTDIITIKSNLTFNGSTGFSALTNVGAVTVNSNLTFTGGAGTNLLVITGVTTVSNNFVFGGNSTPGASNLLTVASTGGLKVLGTFSVTNGNARNAVTIGNDSTFSFLSVTGNLTDLYFNINNAANVVVSNGLSNFGRIDVAGAGTLLRVVPAFTNNSLINLTGGTLAGGTLTNLSGATVVGAGVVSNLLYNAGYLTATNGTLTLTTAPINNNLITVAGGAAPGTLSVTPDWSNATYVVVAAGAATSGGALTNLASGTVTNFGAMNTLVVNRGRVVLNGLLGNYQQTQGTNTISGSGSVTGTATITGGLFDLNGGVYSNGLMLVSGSAVLTNGFAGAAFSGGLSNNATVFVSQNTFFNGAVTNTGAFAWQGAISNNFVQSAGTNTLLGKATITQAATILGGTFDLNGATYSNGLMILGGAGVLTNSSVAAATFNGGLSNAATVAATGTIFFNGIITNTGTFLFNGGTVSNSLVTSGLVTLNNAATVTGNTTVNGGVFNLNGQTFSNPQMIVSGTGVLTNNSTGATVNGGTTNGALIAVTADTFFNGPVTNTGAIFFQGAISNTLVNTGSFNLNANATLTGSPVNNGTINAAGSTLTVIPDWANAGSFQLSGGVLAGGTVTNNSGEGFFGFGTISNRVVNNGTLTASGGTLTLVNAPIQNGTAVVANASVLNVLPDWTNAGLLTNGPTGTVSGGTLTNAGTINGGGVINPQLVNQNRLNFSGTVSNNFLQTSGSFTLAGNATITGNAIINGGYLDFLGKNLTVGQLSIGSSGTASNTATGATITGGVTNAGVVQFVNDMYVLGPVTNTGTWFHKGVISNDVVNSGTFSLFKNSINPRVTGGIINSGSLIFDNNNAPVVNGSITNSGSVAFNATVGGNYVQTAGSLIINQAAGSAVVNGTASISGGTFDLAGKTFSNGLMVLSGSGVLTNATGGATLNGGVSNAATIAVTGDTFFNGVVTNTGALYFRGAISNRLVNAGSFNLNNNATITGPVANTGTLNLNGVTLTVNPAWANAGTVTITGGTLVGGTLTNTLALTGAGTISNMVVNLGIMTATNGTLNLVTNFAQTATVNVANNGILNVTPAWTNNGIVNVVAGGAISGGNLTNLASGTVTNSGAINTLLVNQGRSVLGGLVLNLQQTAGTNTLSGAGTVTGTATISGGVFDLAGGTYTNGLMILGGTGVLTNGNSGATFNGGLSNAANVTLTAPTYFNGVVTNTGGFNFQGAISNNFVNGNAGTVTLTGAATITKTLTLNGGTFNLNGQTVSNGLLIVDGGSGVLTNAGAGATVNGGITNSALIAVTADTFFNGPVTNTGTIYFQGAISNTLVNAGSFNLNNNATLTRAPVNTGTLNAGSSTLTVMPDWANAGSLQISGGVLAGGTVTNLTSEGFFGFGTISNRVVNNGTLTASGGLLTLVNAPVQTGTAIVANASVLNVLPAWTNSGLLTNGPTGTVSGGTLTNSGTLNGGGFYNVAIVNLGRLNFGGTVSNDILQTAGSFTLAGAATITGNATINGGFFDFLGKNLTVAQLSIGPSGTVSNTATGATISGGVTNAGVVQFVNDMYVLGPVTNTGTWFHKGVISNDVVNSGTFSLFKNSINPRVTGGIVNSGSLIFDNNNAPVVNGAITNSGSVAFNGTVGGNYVQTAGTLTMTAQGNGTISGTASISGGTFDLAGRTVTSGLMVVSGSGVLTNAVGGATLNGPVTNAGTAYFNNDVFANGPIINSGTWTYRGAISNNVFNSGTLTLLKNSIFLHVTGGIVNSGSLIFDPANAVIVSGSVTNTGSFSFDGSIGGNLVQSAGRLTLANTSTISGTASVSGGVFDLNGATYSNGLFVLTGTGVLTNGSATAATFNGGLSNAGTVFLTTDTFFNKAILTNAATFGFRGAISNSFVQTAGAFTLLNNGTITGTATITGGTIDLAGFRYTNNLMVLGGTGVLTNSSATAATFNGGLSNAATVYLSAIFLNGIVTNTGALLFNGGTVSNSLVSSGAVTLNNAATVTGNTTVNGGVFNLNGQTFTNAQLIVSGTGVLTNGSTGATVNGGLSNAATVVMTTATYFNGVVTNTGDFSFQGAISNNFVNGNAGTVTLTGAATITKTLTLNGGTFNLNGQTVSNGLLIVDGGNGVLTNAGAGATVNGGITNSALIAVTADTFFNGPVTNTGTIYFQGAISNTLVNVGSFNLNANATLTRTPVNNGTINAAGATLTVTPDWANAGSLQISGGVLAGGTVTNLLGEGIIGFGTISNRVVNNGTLTASGGLLTLVNAPVQTGTTTVANASVLNVLPDWTNSGLLTNGPTGTVSGGTLTNTGTINGGGFYNAAVVNQGRVNFGGILSNSFLQNAGSFTLAGNATITGSVTVNGGTLDLTGNSLTDGLLVIAPGATLTNGVQNATVNGGITNAGLVNLFRDTYVNGPVTNTGTWIQRGAISNSVYNAGTMTLLTNSINLRVTGGIVNTGLLTFDTNGVIYVSGVVSNSGSFSFGDVISNNLVNTAGTITLNGAGTVTGNTAINGGVFNLNGKNFTNAQLIVSGTGLLTNNTAGATVNGGLSNAATIAVTANTYFKGAVTNTGAFFFQGTISNSLANAGTLILNGDSVVTGSALINAGALDLNGMDLGGGLVRVAAGAVLTNSVAGGSVSAGLTNAGSVYSAVAMFFNGAVTNLGAFAWQGAISNNYVQTAGTNTLTGRATITGSATVNGGVFDLNGQTYSNNLLVLAGSGALTNSSATAATFNGGLSNAATVNLSAIFLNGIVTNTGTLLFNGGTISNNFVNAATGTAMLNNAATITGTTTINGGTLNLNGQTLTDGLLRVTGTGVLTNSQAGATVNGGVSNAATLAVTADTFFNGPVTNTGAFVFQGAVSNNFVNSGAGTVTLNGAATITGTTILTGGSLNLNGPTISNGLLIVDGGSGVLTNSRAGATVNGGVSNAALIAVTADTFFNGPVTNTGAISFRGAISNTLVNAGSFNLNNNATLTAAPVNTGTINADGMTLTVNPDWTNAGSLQISGGVLAGGNLTNLVGEVFAGFGTVSNLLVNQGTLTASNGTLTFVQAPVLTGTLNVGTPGTGATAKFGGSAQFILTNTGTINLFGGTILDADLLNRGNLVTVNGGGLISNALVNDVTGFILSTNGTLVLTPDLTNLGVITNSATLIISNVPAATLGSVTNAGTIVLNGGSFLASTITNTGVITGRGTNAAPLINSGAVIATNGELRLTGVVSGNGAYAAVAGTSAATLTFAGGGTVSALFNTNATIQIAAGALTNASALVNQGTVSVAGGASLTVLADWANAGIFSNGVGAALRGGTLTNLAGGTVAGDGFINPLVVNQGRMVWGGTLSNSFAQTSSTGSFTLNGDSTVTGIATISAGSFNLNGNNYTGSVLIVSGSGVLTNSANGAILVAALTNAGTVYLSGDATFTGVITNTGLFIANSANPTFNSAVVNAGTLLLTNKSNASVAGFVNSGTVALLDGSQINNGTGPITNAASGTWIASLGTDVIKPTFYNAGTLLVTNGLLHVQGPFTQSGIATIAADASLQSDNVWINAGTLLLNGGSIQNSDVIQTGTLTGNGTFANNANLSNTGVINVTNGALVIVSGFLGNTNAGTVNIASDGTLKVGTTGNLALTNAGSITLAGGTLLSLNLVNLATGVLTGTGTLTAAVVNRGDMDWSGTINGTFAQLSGTNTLTGAATITGAATVSGGLVDLAGNTAASAGLTLTGTGILTNSSATAATLNGSVSNAVTLGISGNLIFNGIVTNTGSLNFTGGALSNNLVSSGTITLNNAATITGTTTINGGVFNLNGQTFTNLRTVVGATGVLTNGSAGAVFNGNLTNAGTVFLSGTTVFNGSVTNTGKFSLTDNATLTGTLANRGTLTLGSATLTVAPAWANSGTVLLNGGVIASGNFTNSVGGVFQGFGTISNLVANLGTMTVTNGTLYVFDVPLQAGTVNIVTSGVLLVSGALTNSGTMTINNGGSLSGANIVLNTGTINANASNSIASAVIIINSGLVAGGASNAINAGTITVNSTGVLQSQFQTALDTAVITVNSNGTLRFNTNTQNPGNTITLASGAIVEANTAVTLNGANVALPTAGLLTFNGTAGITATNNWPALTGNLTLAVNTAGNSTVGGLAGGAFSLTKTGTGALTLTNNNSFAGGLLINAGTVTLASAGALGGSPVTINAGSALDLNGQSISSTLVALNSGSLVNNGAAAVSLTGPLALGGDSSIGGSSTLTLNGAITGNYGLTKTGTGVLLLTAPSSYTGATTIPNGTIKLGVDNALPVGTTLAVAGTFNLNGFNQTVTGLSGIGTVTSSAGATFTVNTTGDNPFGGTLAGALSLAVSGTGTLTLNLNGVNVYTGSTILNGGTLALVFPNGNNNSDVLPTGTLLNFGGGTLLLTGGNKSASQTAGNLAFTAGASAITLDTSSQSKTLVAGNTWTRNAGSTVNIMLTTVGAHTATLTANPTLLNGILPYATVNGTNWATVTGGNVVALTSYTALPGNGGTTTGNYLRSGSGTITASESINSLKLTTTGSGQSLAISSGQTLTVAGNSLLFAGANDFTISGGNLTAGNGVGAYELIIHANGSGKPTISSAIVDNGANPVALTKSGTNTLTLSGANTYSGATIINAGTLAVSGGTGIGDASAVSLADAPGVTLSLLGSETIGSLAGAGTVALNANTLTTGGNNSNTTFAGVLSGTGGLVKQGTGTFTLTGTTSNSLTGLTTVNAGELDLNMTAGVNALGGNLTVAGGTVKLLANEQLAGNATVTVTGGSFNFNGATETFGSLLIGSGGRVTNGVAGATLNGGISNAGTVFITADTFLTGAITNTGALFFQGAISNALVNSGSFTLNNNATVTAAPSNTGTFNVTSGNTLTVTPAWANSGTVLVNGGTLTGGTLTNNAMIAGAGTITALTVNNAGGVINASGGTLTLASALMQNGIVNAANGGTLNVQMAWQNNGTLNVLSGGAVIGGTLTNTATGTVTNFGAINALLVNQGRVVLGGLVSNLQQTQGTNTVSGSGSITGTATISGGLFDLNGGTYSNGQMILSGTGRLTNNTPGAIFSGGLSNAATVAVTANTFFNGPVVNTGALFFQGAISNALINAGSFTLNNNATLTAAPSNTGTFSVASGNTLTVSPAWANSGTVVVTGGILAGGNFTNNATITGSGTLSSLLVNQNLLVVTNGTLTVTTAPINTGTFNLTAGSTLAVSPAWANAGTVTLGGGYLVGGTLTNNLSVVGMGTISNLLVNAGNLTANNGLLTLAAAPVQNGNVSLTGSGTLSVAQAWQNAGTITLTGGNLTGSTVTNTALISGNGVVSAGLVNNSGTLAVTGGTLTLTTAPTQTGRVNVTSSGTLSVAQAWQNAGTITLTGGGLAGSPVTNTALITGNGVVSAGLVNNSGTLAVTGGTLTLTAAPTQNGTVNIASSGTLNIGQTWQNGGTVTLAGGGLVGATVTNTVLIAGNGAISVAVANQGALRATNGTLTVTAAVSGTGTNFAENSGTLALFGVNSFTSPTWLNGGTVVITNDNNLGAGAAPVVFNNGGVLQTLTNVTLQAARGITLASNGTIDTRNQTMTVAGVISGNGGLTKVGTGLLNLTGGDLYNGVTAIQGGTLAVNGSLASGGGTVTIYNGGTLGGTGTLNRAVVALAGAVLSPGNSPGTINVDSYQWNAGGIYLWQVTNFTGTAGTTTGWDLLNVANQLTFAGGSSANPYIMDLATLGTGGVATNWSGLNGSWQIATAAGGITGFDPTAFAFVTTNFANPLAGYFSVSLTNATSLNLNYSAPFVWAPATGTSNWSANASWVGGVAPVSGTLAYLVFGGDSGYTATNDFAGTFTLNRLLFTNNNSAVTLAGNALRFDGAQAQVQYNTTNTGGAVTINNPLDLAAAVLFTRTTGGVAPGALTLNGPISGSGSLTKSGDWTLVLGGSNSFTGATVINGGQVVVANTSALAASTVNNGVTGGLVFSNTTAAIFGALQGSGNMGLTNTAGAGVGLTVGANGASVFYSGGLSGSGSLTKSGGGSETLTGTNTYAGNTMVNAGTLSVTGQLLGSTNLTVNGGAFNWGSATAMTNTVLVTVQSGGLVTFNNDGTLNGLTGNGQVNIGGNTVQVGFAGASTNFTGTLTGSGTLSKVGGGTWTLTGSGNAVGNVAVSAGTLTLGGGRLAATNLFVTGGQFALNSGTLAVGNAVVSNSANWAVGNGSSAAALWIGKGGTVTLQRDLLVSSNAALQGAATIVVAGGQGSVVIQAGGVQALGGAPGTMTIVGTNVWQGGGKYLWDVNDFAGSPGSGPGWDLVNATAFATAATPANPFVIGVNSLAGSSAGVAANFDFDANYSLVIAAGLNLTTNNIALSLTGFQNRFDGAFQLTAPGGTNLVLNYTGSDVHTWTDTSGSFSGPNNWINGRVPAVGQTNVVLYFGGSTGSGYTANNDLVGVLTKHVVLTNANTATVQTITGNPFSFIGLDPQLDQNGAGAFVISNNLALASTLSAGGSGGGTVTLAGDISGSGTLTKSGAWTLILGGSNTYSGATVVNDGHLFIASSYGLSGSTLSNQVAGAMVFTNNLSIVHLGGLAGTGDLGLTNSAGAGLNLEVGGNGQSTTYGGHLTGAGSLTKVGAGTLILSGINTYSGGTTVTNGMLVAAVLNNGISGSGSSLGSGAILVAGGTLRFGAGSRLAATNSVAGSVSLNGGTLDAANLVNSGHLATLGNTSTITADLANQGYLDLNNGALVTLGNLFNTGIVSNAATLKVGAGGGGWLNNAGQVVLVNGLVDAGMITNAGTISGAGTLTSAVHNTALVSASVSNQLLSIVGVATGSGVYRAEAGATLSFNGGGTLSSLVNTGGTIRVASGILTNAGVFANYGGTLALAGGAYQTSLRFTNTGWLAGAGQFNSPATLVNQGTIAANLGTTNTPLVLNSDLLNAGTVRAAASAFQVTGVFTNNGTLQFISSVGTYNRTVVDNGEWTTAGGASTFANNFIITTNGYVSAAGGSRYVFTSDLFNQSTNNLHWDTLGVNVGTNTSGGGTEFLFSGSGLTQTQQFFHPGLLLTGGFDGAAANPTSGVQFAAGYADGFSNNFAIGQLWLTNTTLVLEQTPGVAVAGGLFVNDLYLFGGSHLVISNNMALYFVNSNAWTLADITLLGNAQIHQLDGLGALEVVPEPNVLLMWLCGGITVWAARRRRGRNHRRH